MIRQKAILVVNGPNLNMLGKREPHIYGATTLEILEQDLKNYGQSCGIDVQCVQSNFEGQIVEYIQDAKDRVDYIIINAGAYTHTSIAIRDALLSVAIPFIEVHISNIYNREDFRHQSYLSDKAQSVLCGFGVYGYKMAIDAVKQFLKDI
jgi:3-dehydroquinate dehydratase-2